MTRRIFLGAAGTWLLPAQTAVPYPEEKPLARLGIVTDIHYADKITAGNRVYRESLGKLSEAVALWNRSGVDAILELGDFVDASPTAEKELADLRRVYEVLSRATAPKHFVLGNHCVSTLTKPQFMDVWKADRSWYSFPLDGYRCIVLDSAFSSDGQPYGGRDFDWKDAFLPQVQIEWLRQELEAGRELALVFVHHRLDTDDHYSVSNAAAVRAALEASGKVVAVFQGHQHVNDHREIGGIHYCTLEAMVEGQGPANSSYGTIDLFAGGKIHLNGLRLLESRQLPAPSRFA